MTTPGRPGGPADEQDALQEEMRAVVRRRREAGEYPPGLERDLDEHFQRMVGRSAAGVDLERQLEALDAAAQVGRHRIHTDSRRPGGSVLHAAVARAVARQTDGILAQLQDFATAVRDLLHTVAQRLPDDEVRDVSARVDLLLDRVAAYERVPATAEPHVRDLAARVEALEAAMLRLESELRPPADVTPGEPAEGAGGPAGSATTH
jgi:hypothetical protein